MRVLIDTTIWSFALRRRPKDLNPNQRHVLSHWQHLLESGDAFLIGPVRQEVLSGLRNASDFTRIQYLLNGVDCHILSVEDHDLAASCFNTLRSHGIQGGDIDMMICATAKIENASIFTADADFARYCKWLGVRLYDASGKPNA